MKLPEAKAPGQREARAGSLWPVRDLKRELRGKVYSGAGDVYTEKPPFSRNRFPLFLTAISILTPGCKDDGKLPLNLVWMCITALHNNM